MVVIHAYHACGSARTALQLLAHARQRMQRTAVIGLNGGGHWSDRFVRNADIAVIAVGGSPDWANVPTAATVSAHHFPALRWALEEVPERIPLVVHIHTEVLGDDAKATSLMRAAIQRRATIVFPTPRCQDQYRSLLSAHEWSSFLRLSRLLPTAPSLPPGETPETSSDPVLSPSARIAVVSRIDADKIDIHYLISTIKLVLGSIPRAEFVIAGFGEALPALRWSLYDLPPWMRERIELLGHVDDVQSLYRSVDVVFLPSYTEVFPHVVLEAAQFGLRSVTPDFGYSLGAADHIALHVPNGDAARASECLLRVLEKRTRRVDRASTIRLLRSMQRQWENSVERLFEPTSHRLGPVVG